MFFSLRFVLFFFPNLKNLMSYMLFGPPGRGDYPSVQLRDSDADTEAQTDS